MRNNTSNLFIFTALFLFFSNCKKSALPDDLLETPVFSVDADINGQKEMVTTDVAKGDYMYTSFGMDTTTNVMILYGTLAQPNCADGHCPGSLRFEFRNIETGTQVLINELIRKTEYEYTNSAEITQGKTEYRLKLKAPNSVSGQVPMYLWAIPGIGDFQEDSVDTPLPNAEDRTISLTSIVKGFTSRVTRTISIDTLLNAGHPKVGISLELDSQSISATVFPIQSGVKYVWLNGDTTESILEEIITKEFFVTATNAISKKNASARLLLDAPLNSTTPVSTLDFKETIIKTISPGSLELGRVAIQWVSPDGMIWRSDKRTQLADNFFIVRDVSAYETNENQQKTYKLWVEFKCTLYNTNGQSIPASGKGFIAVAYP
jgi:hypothetical protein